MPINVNPSTLSTLSYISTLGVSSLFAQKSQLTASGRKIYRDVCYDAMLVCEEDKHRKTFKNCRPHFSFKTMNPKQYNNGVKLEMIIEK